MKATHIGWIAAFCVVLAGCSQAPTADIDAAKKALDEARQAQAAEYAEQSWTIAQDADAKLETELETQDQRWSAMRSYTVARELAQATKAAAERSRDEAIAGKEQAKTEVATLMSAARDEVGRAHAAVASAPKGKGTEADLASLKSDTSSLDDTLAEMQKLYDDGQFKEAKVKAQAAIDAAKQVEAEVEKAKSQRRSA
jgi:hypothetical protein